MSSRQVSGMLLLLGIVCGCASKPPVGRDPGPPEVTVAHPTVDKLTETTDLTGVLDAVEFVEVRPRVSGFILEVKLKDGEEVKAGDVLFEIDPAPYKAILDQAKAQLLAYEAELKFSEADLARSQKLLASGGINREDYERSLAKKAVSAANIQGGKAALDRAKLDYDWTKVTAPISGRADRVYLTKGNVVTGGLSQGTILTTLVSTDKIYAYFDINEQVFDYYVDQVRKKRFAPNKGGIEVNLALQGEKGYPHKGTIDFSANRFSPTTGSLQLRAVIENPGKEMIAGRQIRAQVPLSDPYEALFIPDEAIILDQGSRFVYIVDAENKVRARPIKVGPVSKGLRVVSEGITKGDWIVIKGQQRIRPDVTVKPIKPEVKE